MIENEQIAWAAGLFEGEGCFFVNAIKNDGKIYKYPCAMIKMTDEDVIRRFATVIGFGKVWFRKTKIKHHKDLWWWRCHGSKETNILFEMFKPYLCSRRHRTAIDILENNTPIRSEPEHGTRRMYRSGCRCDQCKLFQAERLKQWRQIRQRGGMAYASDSKSDA